MVSSAASVDIDKGFVRVWKLALGAKAAAEPIVARKANVENFIFNFDDQMSLRCCERRVKTKFRILDKPNPFYTDSWNEKLQPG